MAPKKPRRAKYVTIGTLRIHTNPTKAEIDALYRRVGTVVAFTHPAPRPPPPYLDGR